MTERDKESLEKQKIERDIEDMMKHRGSQEGTRISEKDWEINELD